jgi:hypothetical protein
MLCRIVLKHQYGDHGQHHSTIEALPSPTHRFSADCHAGHHIFVPPRIYITLDVLACRILFSAIGDSYFNLSSINNFHFLCTPEAAL